MREAVVYEDATRERKHLRLVLQAAEGGRENQTVVVAFELRPDSRVVRLAYTQPFVMPFWMTMLLSEALVGYQLLPIHHN